MWRRDIRVVIIPSILAFTYLGPSIYLDSSVELDLLPLVLWMTSVASASDVFLYSSLDQRYWWGPARPVVLTALTASMTVNALVTGLIVFKIFKVFREVKRTTTADGKSLGITNSGSKLRSVLFVIIESGMTLFAIQLLRVVLSVGQFNGTVYIRNTSTDAFVLISNIHAMLNVIISSLFLYILLITWLGYNTYYHPGAGVNGFVFPRPGIFGRSCR